MSHRKFLKPIEENINRSELSRYKKAVFVLHDQLNLNVWPEWIRKEKPLLVFIESEAKHRELPYHKKKLTYVISSMRHFALQCKEEGFSILYHSTENHYREGLMELIEVSPDLQVSYMTPSEWDSRGRLQNLREDFPHQVSEIPNKFFIAEPDNWKGNINPGYRMEYFYREMRRKTGYLMNGDQPLGGEWNYDDQNREPLPEGLLMPEVSTIEPDEVTREVMDMVETTFGSHFGTLEDFRYAVTRKQAVDLLEEFIDERLANFGPYEDAMALGQTFLFHSNLSLYLNNGLLLPSEICDRAIKAYEDGIAPLNSVEGLIRQLIGWREFVRVYYEAMMPAVRDTNFMNFDESLPEVYWSGQTKMQCVQQSLKPVLEQGYSHHIQRLMVLSNFSNLTKTDPRELNRWFWLAYADAYEWVVLPNVLGMSTFADGGVLASKPYVSSGNYINKMSNYCNSCKYNVNQKTGVDACPFNYLFWNFVNEQREVFMRSGRNSFMINMFDKKAEDEQTAIKESSKKYLDSLPRSKSRA
ncbi:MAG: cryptochrome/photolyase family protein [Balneolaceae bacterium]|jgi:deoxyribodipyrimidine photolyase-related protein